MPLRRSVAFLLSLSLVSAAAFSQPASDAAAQKVATDAILANKAPCGQVTRAVRNADGTIVADCANGAAYMVVQAGSRATLLRYNTATNKWTPYP